MADAPAACGSCADQLNEARVRQAYFSARIWIVIGALLLAGAGAAYYVAVVRPGNALQYELQAPAGNVAALGQYLQRAPRDARAWAIYARLNVERADYAAAAAAYAHALELPGRVAQDPMVWCEYADALATLGGGRLAGQPFAMITRALALNPRHPRALEMAGSAAIEQGNYNAALQYWEPLLQFTPVDAPQYRELLSAIERTRLRAAR